MSESPAPLTPSTTSTVAVLAFAVGLLALTGNIANYKLTRQVVMMIEVVEARDAKVNSDQAKAISKLIQKTKSLEELEQTVTELKAAQATAVAEEAAAPE